MSCANRRPCAKPRACASPSVVRSGMLNIGSSGRCLCWGNLHRPDMIGQCAPGALRPTSGPEIGSMSKGIKAPRRTTAACMIVLAALSSTLAHADQREDFLAGRTRECSRCDLAGMNFKRRDLSGADLTEANLRAANLHDARLVGARLAGADLTGANLNKANLSRAELAGAVLRDAMLYAAILDGAKLADADLTDALMGVARLTRADFTKATLRNVDLRKARLADAILTGADLSTAALDLAFLRGARFDGASLKEARLMGAEPAEASFVGAALPGAKSPVPMRWARIFAAPIYPRPCSPAPTSGAPTCTRPSSRARSSGRRQCPMARSGISESLSSGNSILWRSLRADADFQPRRTFELALGQLRRQLRIDAALAGFAEIVGAHDDLQSARHVGQFTGLLDEQRADGALAFGCRQRNAIARGVGAMAPRHGNAKAIGG